MSFFRPPAFPHLQTQRLQLREVDIRQDNHAYHRILSNQSVAKHSELPKTPTLSTTKRYLNTMASLHQRGTGCAWVLELSESQQLLGAIRINEIQQKIQCGMIAYELHPEHWNQGYATEALQAVVQHAHVTQLLNRLEAWTTINNPASERVLQKNSFLYEGTQRQKVCFNGQFHDIKLYGRLRTDKLP